jgi:hypothetical protein
MSTDLKYKNISEKYKFQWVAPERTGSRKVAEILSYYGFTHEGRKIFNNGTFHHSHYYTEEQKHDGYKLIVSTRNPYSRAHSLFRNYFNTKKNSDKYDFKSYLLNMSDAMKGLLTKPILAQKPDYIIRLENMREDLMKLPFIFDVLNENQLSLLTQHGKQIEPWEDFYDEEGKEIVYNLIRNHFDFFGYEK